MDNYKEIKKDLNYEPNCTHVILPVCLNEILRSSLSMHKVKKKIGGIQVNCPL
jgi:hypothetical protein